MPTFIFFRNKTKIDKIQGADNKALEEKVNIYNIYEADYSFASFNY